jgi:hypothetical protein
MFAHEKRDFYSTDEKELHTTIRSIDALKVPNFFGLSGAFQPYIKLKTNLAARWVPTGSLHPGAIQLPDCNSFRLVLFTIQTQN